MFAVCGYEKTEKFIKSIDLSVIISETKNRLNFLNN